MDCRMPDFPVHHQLPELTQTHVHWVRHPTISSSVVPFFSCLQSFPALGSFQMSQFFASGGQSIGTLASASVLPMNIQGWFPLGLTGLLSLSPTDSQESFSTPHFKSINSLALRLLYGPTFTSTYECWKNHSSDYMIMSLKIQVNIGELGRKWHSVWRTAGPKDF